MLLGGGSKLLFLKSVDSHKSGNVMSVNCTPQAHVYQPSVSVILDTKGYWRDKRQQIGYWWVQVPSHCGPHARNDWKRLKRMVLKEPGRNKIRALWHSPIFSTIFFLAQRKFTRGPDLHRCLHRCLSSFIWPLLLIHEWVWSLNMVPELNQIHIYIYDKLILKLRVLRLYDFYWHTSTCI